MIAKVALTSLVLTFGAATLSMAAVCDCTGTFSPDSLTLENETWNSTYGVWEGYGSLTALNLDTDCQSAQYEFQTDRYLYVWSAKLDAYGSYNSYEFSSLQFSAAVTYKVFNIYVRASQRLSSWRNYLNCSGDQIDFAWGYMDD